MNAGGHLQLVQILQVVRWCLRLDAVESATERTSQFTVAFGADAWVSLEEFLQIKSLSPCF